MKQEFRIERDSLGEVQVPVNAYFGAQTARAVQNFPISGLRLSSRFIAAQAMVKRAAAVANMKLDQLDRRIGEAITQACDEIIAGKLHDQFVVDVYQAGAGTSQNMNANEVIATRALEILGEERTSYTLIHPNDHVNMAQSTNDTIPTSIHISTALALQDFYPVLNDLQNELFRKAKEYRKIFKSGRTHLQDAVPITLGQEFSGYAAAIQDQTEHLKQTGEKLLALPLGGTAAGTGLNAHPRYRIEAVGEISRLTGLPFQPAANLFKAIQNPDPVLQVSGALRSLTVTLCKIASDIRLLSSGPATGLYEIKLPPVQPGSSIMPGKVNPVMAEMPT